LGIVHESFFDLPPKVSPVVGEISRRWNVPADAADSLGALTLLE
jgi:hypothetical protein